MKMKKRNIIVIPAIAIMMIFTLWGCNRIPQKPEEQEPENINEVTEIALGEEAWIDSCTKISIENTNDYFEITEKVKWEVPEHPAGTTVSFSIPIPYTFVVDGVSYDGIYELGDSAWNENAEGLEYNLEIINLTKDGKIKIEVTK